MLAKNLLEKWGQQGEFFFLLFSLRRVSSPLPLFQSLTSLPLSFCFSHHARFVSLQTSPSPQPEKLVSSPPSPTPSTTETSKPSPLTSSSTIRSPNSTTGRPTSCLGSRSSLGSQIAWLNRCLVGLDDSTTLDLIFFLRALESLSLCSFLFRVQAFAKSFFLSSSLFLATLR